MASNKEHDLVYVVSVRHSGGKMQERDVRKTAFFLTVKHGYKVFVGTEELYRFIREPALSV